ncbi:MAG: hypothetical protein QOH25_39 [Acidobacteriota bacterium]|jgi:hypothetical protein|nr:hypothetical protein [Acidobacteriota bacterium]
MRNKIKLAPLAIALFALIGYAGISAHAAIPLPTPTPTPPLNNIKIGQCGTKEKLESLSEDERSRGLVIDARPFAINQSTGKLSFNGSTGRVTVLHTNPFIYDYQISVAQEELVSTALTDFVKLLLPPGLRSDVGLQSGTPNRVASQIAPVTRLSQIASRLEPFDHEACNRMAQAKPQAERGLASSACEAVNEMNKIFEKLEAKELIQAGGVEGKALEQLLFTSAPKYRNSGYLSVNDKFKEYTAYLTLLRDEEADAYKVCNDATDMNTFLSGLKGSLDTFFEQLVEARREIKEIDVLAGDLEDLVKAYNADTELKNAGKDIRCRGLNCAEQFKAYAQTVLDILGAYTTELDALSEKAKAMQNALELTNQMKKREGLFARTFTIIKRFELSQATISINRIKDKKKLGADASGAGRTESGTPNTRNNRTSPRPIRTGGGPSDGTVGGNNFAERGGGDSADPEPETTDELPTEDGDKGSAKKEEGKKEEGNGSGPVAAGQIKEVVQIGRPRFMLSGGLVYSPLPRRTFTSIKGFTHDAQGNPTGNGNADIVGFDENSSRRLLPMVFLNTRLFSSKPASLYFSLGVTAKHDNDVDVEYLFGPSVGLLNDRALFTFGVYGGKTQNLVPDLNIGDELPDDIGNAKLYRKSYTWKPGFSFSYSFSGAQKKDKTGTGGGSSVTADASRNEIRIGSIPFNLALGLAYTSLEERTYNAVVGFARDRQGNLTNGQTLTRIVGLTSSSNYRMTPLALLHSRLTNFGGHDFYFSTGLTGKKTDNSFDIEYLLGGSVNLYQRKVFLTVGAFAGKQQILGGDFFEGAKLDSGQGITTQKRYVWKPAISISYDISKIMKR